MFLSDAELRELTGYKQTAAQRRWLRKNGIKHFRQRITGRLIVPRDSLLSNQKGPAEEEGPRLEWIRGRTKAA